MATTTFSPIFNASQLFTGSGLPLAGGLVSTFLAGSSTPAATYIDSTGVTANSNPIVLDASGRFPAEVWLTAATAYKFVVTDSLGANPLTYDNITGIGAAGGVGSFTDLTTTGNTILGSTTANTLNVGNGGIVKDASGNTTIGGSLTVSGANGITATKITLTGTSVIAGVGVCKTATTSRASTTTLADDPNLIATLPTGVFEVELFVPLWATTSGAGGFKYSLAFSGTATGAVFAHLGMLNNTLTGTTTVAFAPVGSSGGSAIVASTSTAAADFLRISASLTVTVAGNISFQWAQNSSNANATNVGIGASMICTKVG